MEMCMPSLDRAKASAFFKSNSTSAAAMMTDSSGIRKILPYSEIFDFEFDPCGYSMNGIEGSAILTVHSTPEDGLKLLHMHEPKAMNLNQLVWRVMMCFQPSDFSIDLHADVLEKMSTLNLKGYRLEERSCEELGIDGSIVYQKFVKTESCGSR